MYGILATLVEREDELSAETRKELLRVGYEQGERLRRLLEQLLDLSRLDARSIDVRPTSLALGPVLTGIVAEVVPQGTPVRLEVEPDLAAVADPVTLDRVVSNLLINAMRYGRPPIKVSAGREDGKLRIAVEDSGEGVPEELRPHLFERFTRGGDARGSGLGLAIARSYAEAHGGELLYEPGATGARFELVLPQP